MDTNTANGPHARATGGTVRNYVVERREHEDSDMNIRHPVGTAIETEIRLEDQPRGVEIRYRVTASNTNGPGPAVTSDQVVL